MIIRFTKMHGAGNDFMVINALAQAFSLTAEQIKKLSDRHTGVGFDQLLVLEQARDTQHDFFYRIFNADGQEVGQCGNGARCIARFIQTNRLSTKQQIILATKQEPLTLTLNDEDQITVELSPPKFEPAKIPLRASARADHYEITLDNKHYSFFAVSMGNPHAVLIVDDVTTAPVLTVGPQIMKHADFPEQVNVGFMQILDKNNIMLRVYERGAGETAACGSGACAAVVAGIQRGLLNTTTNVYLPGGILTVSWAGENQPVLMSGPAVIVFEGQLEL